MCLGVEGVGSRADAVVVGVYSGAGDSCISGGEGRSGRGAVPSARVCYSTSPIQQRNGLSDNGPLLIDYMPTCVVEGVEVGDGGIERMRRGVSVRGQRALIEK